MFRVVTPAADRSLLSIEEARAAAGVAGSGQDAALGALALAISDIIARECGVVADGIVPPTLRAEACEDTFRRSRCAHIALSRRFVTTVAVTEAGLALDGDAYELDPLAGMLTRLDGDRQRRWGDNVVVAYTAGFAAVPADLKRIASMALREASVADSRDPLLRSETVDDVGRFDYQIGGSGRDEGSMLPPAAADVLGSYSTVSIG